MPAGNGTGPLGMGPMTGRAAGYCAGYATPGHMSGGGRGFGMGFGAGRGRGSRGGGGFGGRGFRHRFLATGLPGWVRGGWGGATAPEIPPEQELTVLKQQADSIGKELEAIRGRIQELEARPTGPQ